MAQSRRYKRLQKRMAALEAMLPAIKVTGRYTEFEYDQVRAFQLLAHAELEACIEDLAIETLDKCMQKWKLDGRPRKPIVALLAYSEQSLALPEDIGSPTKPIGTIRSLLDKAKSHFSTVNMHQNNGVLQRNVLGLLLPVGVSPAEIDNTWLLTLDSFGRARGDAAHSSAIKLTVNPDPVAERDTVRQLVAGMAPLDERLLVLGR